MLSKVEWICGTSYPRRITRHPQPRSLWRAQRQKDLTMKFHNAVPALLLLLAASAFAQHRTFTADPDKSDVAVTLKTNHDIVHGGFHLDTGTIDFDRRTPQLTGSIIVAAGSGKTGNDMRDRKMNKEILRVDQYTTVAFAPKSYTGTIPASGDGNIEVTGTFTLINQPHQMTIPIALHVEGDVCTARAHLVVPYVQWGVKSPNFLFWKAENTVDVDLNLRGRLAGSATSGP